MGSHLLNPVTGSFLHVCVVISTPSGHVLFCVSPILHIDGGVSGSPGKVGKVGKVGAPKHLLPVGTKRKSPSGTCEKSILHSARIILGSSAHVCMRPGCQHGVFISAKSRGSISSCIDGIPGLLGTSTTGGSTLGNNCPMPGKIGTTPFWISSGFVGFFDIGNVTPI